MMPVAPLMIEHRLIERMLRVVNERILVFEKNAWIDPEFVDATVDFVRTYADNLHHGKEEDILFRDLASKPLSAEHRAIMDELLEDHRWGRRVTKQLLEAKEEYLRGDKNKITEITALLGSLVEFYPKHIEKEDRRFFLPCMAYFNEEEKQKMLEEESEFDRNFIHEKYRAAVGGFEELIRKEAADRS